MNKSGSLSIGGWFILVLVLTIFLAGQLLAEDTVSLKVYEGYNFSNSVVTKRDDKSADVSFFVNQGRSGALSFALGALGGKKIKEFGKEKPNVRALSPREVNGWKDYVNAPSPGYYAVLDASGKNLYLLNVLSFKNQGKAASYWELTFSWVKIITP